MAVETNRKEIVSRLKREGWVLQHGGEHDKYRHPQRKGLIVVPRHRTISKGVARNIAKGAGWV